VLGKGGIYVLSKILGHASVTMTEKVYAHLLKEDLFQRSQSHNSAHLR
jgi:integrase